MKTVTKSKKVLFTFKIDKDLKDDISRFFESIDMPISAYLNNHLRELQAKKEFTLKVAPQLKKSVLKNTKKALSDYKSGKLKSLPINNFIAKLESGKL
jgi:antitoxin component of RelBE/YafQ-DinJ toxin-antitoxin module